MVIEEFLNIPMLVAFLNQQVFYVTERAVFQLVEEGLKLIEIGPGLDLQRDVLSKMDFDPIISDELKMTDQNIYQKDWGELRQSIQHRTHIDKGEDKYEL